MTKITQNPLRVGVGGPVGSGKTALIDALCKRMRDRFEIAVVTNDIYTREDAEFLVRSEALAPERIRGVETGGCPHTAIREDASMNLAAIDDLVVAFPRLDLVIDKIDLAPYVGASLEVMDNDARRMRGDRPFVFTNVRAGEGVEAVERFIVHAGVLDRESAQA